MKSLSKILISMIFISLTTNCTKNQAEDAKEGVQNTIKEYKIMGIWESTCQKSKVLGLSMREFYKFSGNGLVKATELYATEDCKNSSARIQYEGKFQISDKNHLGENSRYIDLDYQKVYITPLSKSGTSLLKKLSFCDVSEWTLDTKVNLTGTSNRPTCPIEHTPQKIYDITKIEDSKLYFGAGKSKMDLASRPMELNKDVFFTESHQRLD